MTFMIILGVLAGLYLVVLMFRLASIALPFYAGIGAGFWLLDRHYGYGASIAAGLMVGILILFFGRLLCATLPPIFRGIVALAFALPAGFAGYQAAKGLAGLALAEGAFLELLGFVGAITAATAAWQSLGTRQEDRAETETPVEAASGA